MKKNMSSDAIKQEFLNIHADIRELSDDVILNAPEDVFRPYLDKLNQLAAMEVDDHTADKILNDPEFQQIKSCIAHVKRINALRMETACCRAIIDAPDPWTEITCFVYYPNYLQLAQMEYQGGGLREGDRVVFLGSGPLPLSLISLCRQFNIQGIGIEQSPEIFNISQQLIDALGLTDHIRILQGNHFSLPLPETCQLIMIGADALPKDEIFSHLARVLPDGTKLSYRIYEKGLRRLLDDQSVFVLPPEFEEYTRLRPELPVNNTSVFIKKMGNGN